MVYRFYDLKFEEVKIIDPEIEKIVSKGKLSEDYKQQGHLN